MASPSYQKFHLSVRAGKWHALLVLLLTVLLPFLMAACLNHGNLQPGPTINQLKAVVALSASDIWAVGDMSTSKDPGSRVLIEHWDGKQWHAAMPDIQGELVGISADSANDIWAVGDVYSRQLLILHWDGNNWRQFSFPPLSGVSNDLNSVLALSQNNAWAVGSAEGNLLIEHWR